MPLPPAPQYEAMPQQTSWAAQPVGFVDAVTTCLRKYVDFSGRASRSEFWFFVLAYWVASSIPVIGPFLGLALLLPDLAVSARRLHDTGKSGWWQVLPNGLFLAGAVVFLSAAATAAGAAGNLTEGSDEAAIEAAAASVAGTLPIVLLLWLAAIIVTIVLFCKKGQDERNQYDD
ncbi:MAG: DUF805 domain-containing protein [Ottowia sp.]|nr:DUF805 domain-containing protein [Ottowia sp.]